MAAAKAARIVYVGTQTLGGRASYVSLQRPTFATVELDTPDALYPGERYVLATPLSLRREEPSSHHSLYTSLFPHVHIQVL